MPQIKRFMKPLSWLVNVATFGPRSRQKLSASTVLALAAATVCTTAYALTIEVKVNNSTVLTLGADTTAAPSDPGPYEVKVTIPNGNYPSNCATPSPCVNIVGGTATATVIKNGTSISTSTSIVTKVNVSGNFKYLGADGGIGIIEIITSNKFALPTGVWTTAGKGGSKVWKTATGAYVANATCFPNTSTIQAGSCTFGRSYNATDEGYVYRTVSGAQQPAGGVEVELRSEVGFFDTAGNMVRTEIVGGAFPANPRSLTDHKLFFRIDPLSTYQEDAHFYLGTSLGGAGEVVPCEPLNTGTSTTTGGASFTCASNERKINKLKFSKLKTNDLVNLPVTSTDLGASDPGILALHSSAKILVDVQPIGVVKNTRTEDPEACGEFGCAPPQIEFPFLGDANNDWNPTKTTGKKQVLALNSYKPDGSLNVNLCDIETAQHARITIAGSALVPAESSQEAVKGGACIGRVFVFDYGPVNAAIPVSPNNEFPTKLAACQANPTATLFVSGVQLSSEYQIASPAQGGRPSSPFAPPDANCLYDAQTNKVTCTDNDAEVSGSQLVRCCTSCG